MGKTQGHDDNDRTKGKEEKDLERRKKRGSELIDTGAVVGGIGAILSISFVWRSIARTPSRYSPEMGETYWIIFGVFMFVTAAFIIGGLTLRARRQELQKKGRMYLSESAEEVLDRDRRPPVLYLRSFRDDTVAGRVIGASEFGALHGEWVIDQPALRTEEEQLCEALNVVGPVIAIGEPEEKLPDVGAARTYVNAADWKRVVRKYMTRARLVVVRLGESAGLRWELQEALTRLAPDQLLILIPYGKRHYEEKRAWVRANLPERPGWPRLPQNATSEETGPLHLFGINSLSLAGALYFGPGWRPRLLLFTYIGSGNEGGIRGALAPVYRQLGATESS